MVWMLIAGFGEGIAPGLAIFWRDRSLESLSAREIVCKMPTACILEHSNRFVQGGDGFRAAYENEGKKLCAITWLEV